jgi:hypothetical protein
MCIHVYFYFFMSLCIYLFIYLFIKFYLFIYLLIIYLFIFYLLVCLCVRLHISALNEIDDALREFREKMLKAFPELCKRVNFFYGRHYREAVKNFGVAALLSVCMEEMLHGVSKHRVTCSCCFLLCAFVVVHFTLLRVILSYQLSN